MYARRVPVSPLSPTLDSLNMKGMVSPLAHHSIFWSRMDWSSNYSASYPGSRDQSVWRPSSCEANSTHSHPVVFCQKCHCRIRIDASDHNCDSPNWDALARKWYAWAPTASARFSPSLRFRVEQLKEFQSRMLDKIAHGYDVIGIHGTGSGKSLVFQLLGAAYPYWTNVVFMPTRALVQDQITRITERGFIAKHVTSVSEIIGMDPGPLAEAVHFIP